MPKRHLSFFKNEVTLNPWIWYAIALCVFITGVAYVIPPIAKTLSMVPLTAEKFGLVVLFGFGSLAFIQIIKRLKLVN